MGIPKARSRATDGSRPRGLEIRERTYCKLEGGRRRPDSINGCAEILERYCSKVMDCLNGEEQNLEINMIFNQKTMELLNDTCD